MKNDFERQKFEVSGNTYDIDEWYKGAEALALKCNLSMTDREPSRVQKILWAMRILREYEITPWRGDFEYVPLNILREMPGEDSVSYERDSYGGCYRWHEKEVDGFKFRAIEVITLKEYELTALEGVA